MPINRGQLICFPFLHGNVLSLSNSMSYSRVKQKQNKYKNFISGFNVSFHHEGGLREEKEKFEKLFSNLQKRKRNQEFEFFERRKRNFLRTHWEFENKIKFQLEIVSFCEHFSKNCQHKKLIFCFKPPFLAQNSIYIQLSTSSLRIHGGAIFSAVSGRKSIPISAIEAPEHGAWYRLLGFYLTTTFCSTLAQQAVSH